MKDECREVLADLQRYLDGECPGNLEAVMHQHLGDCPPCLERADFEEAVRHLIASKCRDAAPSDLVDRVLDSLRRTAPDR